MPTLYEVNEKSKFKPGTGKVVVKSNSDKALLIGVGITVHEAIKAARELKLKGINVRVFDPFTIKPIDASGIAVNARDCNCRVVTVANHVNGKCMPLL